MRWLYQNKKCWFSLSQGWLLHVAIFCHWKVSKGVFHCIWRTILWGLAALKVWFKDLILDEMTFKLKSEWVKVMRALSLLPSLSVPPPLTSVSFEEGTTIAPLSVRGGLWCEWTLNAPFNSSARKRGRGDKRGHAGVKRNLLHIQSLDSAPCGYF